jgi:hypothetical protein
MTDVTDNEPEAPAEVPAAPEVEERKRPRTFWIVGVAAAVIAIVAVGCGGSSQNYGSVTGRVIDARTHKPVAGARVSDGPLDAVTDATGLFVIRAVPRTSTLVVSAKNYRSATRQPSPSAGDISVTPVPVRGVVSSGLTRQGLAGATVVAGATPTKAAAGGRFALYGVGPGTKLFISASGYIGATATVSVSRSVSVSLKPTDATLLANDMPLIKAVWRDNSDAWGDGGNTGQASVDAWITAHNYPGVDPNYARCDRTLPTAYSEEYVLDQSSVQRNDGWVMTFGPLKGQVPKGRIYIMKITTSYSDGSPQQLDEVHVSILDGKPYVFYHCEL